MLPQLAARLCGGFVEMAPPEVLFPLIRAALVEGGFSKFNDIAGLPGMPRAVMQALGKIWNADLELKSLAERGEQMADLKRIEAQIRGQLPAAWLLPSDLRDRAAARADKAPKLFGPIVLDGIVDIEPLWRPLINAMVPHVEWRTSGKVDRKWFAGHLVEQPLETSEFRRVEAVADHRSEVIEALRWARELMSSGTVVASDIAIASTSPSDYDEHMLVLRREASLPINFVGGIPALSTAAGQTCAALADILLRGLSQDRVRRLLLGLPKSGALTLLPADWSRGIRPAASLNSVVQWETTLSKARDRRADSDLAEHVLLPILRRLDKGIGEALELGELLLGADAKDIWKDALRASPAEALAMSLQHLRVADENDAANSVVWCSADQLAASPRPATRLIGLSVRSWPRTGGDDPLVPHHVVPRRELQARSVTEIDRTSFDIITGHARHLALSRSRRSVRGGLQAASPLWPKEDEVELARMRVPVHCFSEADRLLSRPTDAMADPKVSRSRARWRAALNSELNPFDGLIPPNHPVILRTLEQPLSSIALRLLLRDPQAFMWHRGFDWRPREFAHRPLVLNAASFGELVHELIAASVRQLDRLGGVQKTSTDEREQVVRDAAAGIEAAWPLERAVPPATLWATTIGKAVDLTLHALRIDEDLPHSLNTWTELNFGGATNPAGAPWPEELDVILDGTGVRVIGRIDRLDLAKSGSVARITDYKTSKPELSPDDLVMDGGRELQRVLYAIAIRTLARPSRVVARLLFLGTLTTTRPLENDRLDKAITDLSAFVNAATTALKSGFAIAGPDAFEKYSAYRLARPADLQGYLADKGDALSVANAPLEDWRSCP
ncbi:PD-(D/E)XK nuclease family protein [Mesorhizobium sp. Mes31]|uniref:PD-(D/E)XK nuclease family protein n=1 Tax=Mesorhizobium sp. Mes31 TaxID=2926017 RepID=UPI002118F95B|nr:PD-(D/E)XK nuclease family protein [Mesorhizobium sp. Mes31]